MNSILLVGAALVGLPVLLHLIMKQEPKRLPFPAFRFLTQKLKTNQRKLRLRHFLLLALRMIIIALFAITLYQPTFKSERLAIQGESPIATVIVIDTTPSMGYVVNDKSRLEEAKRRALELLDELPDKSPVAVLDTAEPGGAWLLDREAARRRIEEMRETKGGQAVTGALAVAYQLLAKVDQETDAADPLPKFVAVFTDRTAASWDGARADDLKKLQAAVPDPKPVHVVVDFGAEAAANVGIVGAEMKPQVIPEDRPATVRVTVTATGSDRAVDVTVNAKLGGAAKPESRTVSVPPNQTRDLTFEFRDLKVGLHQVEFALAQPDKLAADNVRYLTFKVGEAKRLLTIADDPNAVEFWQRAHVAGDAFACIVVTPDDVELNAARAPVVKYAPNPAKPADRVTDDLSTFDAVCLLSVRNPNRPNDARPDDGSLWNRLRPYLRANGKVLIVPGSDTATDLAGYNGPATDLMPATLKQVVETRKLTPAPPPQPAPGWPEPRDGKKGVTWVLDDAALKHPMLALVETWRQQKLNLDVFQVPRMNRKYWDAEPVPGATVIVSYRDAEDAKARRPAVLERAFLDDRDGNRPKGKVVLLTTRLDNMPADDTWHDYWEQDSTWFATFPYLLARYLAGDTADANFNYAAGAQVTVPVPRGRIPRDARVVLDGPPGSGDDPIVKLGEKQAELRLGPPRTSVPGNYAVSAAKPAGGFHWRDGFSTNAPPDEFNLAKVPVEEIEKVTDKGRVFAIDKNATLRDWLTVTMGQPVDLFPWLLLAVLVLFSAEGLIANRFYRRAKP